MQKKMQDLAARDAEFVKLAEARERDRHRTFRCFCAFADNHWQSSDYSVDA
ncbi:MAG: hypothetical protein ACKOEH_06785 [Actinomycetota bacterium]